MFCAGSLARKEIGKKSDLDVFVVADRGKNLESRLCEYKIYADLIRLNDDLGLPQFSNDGEFLKVHFLDDLINNAGSRRDDSENLFTTRMLLILESVPVLNDQLYYKQLDEVVDHYYRDRHGQEADQVFRPLFLLNDILRYWRTLCLNYEERRNDPHWPWHKKNVNLKYSRMMTVFSTVLPLVVRPIQEKSELLKLCGLTALERLAYGVDLLGDASLSRGWPSVLDTYEDFLKWKEDDDTSKYLEGGHLNERVTKGAEALSTFLYAALTHENIRADFRRYLIL